MQTIIVDTTPGYRMPTVFYSQGDIGTQFAIDLRSRFGDTLPANPTVTIQATKPSGLGYSVAATSFSSGVAIFTMTETMTNEAGRFPAELKVVDGSVTLFTANFYMEGEASAHPEGTTDGDIEHILPRFMSVNVETLAAGTDATYSYDPVTNSAKFGIPQGANGSLASSVLAPTYSTSATYAVGDYVYYNGNLYRCTTAITTAEAWTSIHWALVAVGPELTDVKSALNYRLDKTENIFTELGKVDGLISNTGAISAETNYYTTDFLPVEASTTYYISYDGGIPFKFYLIGFYDSSKQFISRLVNTGLASFTTPANCKYARFTSFLTDLGFKARTSVNKGAMYPYVADKSLHNIENWQLLDAYVRLGLLSDVIDSIKARNVIDSNNKWFDYNNGYHITIPVTAGEQCEIKGRVGGTSVYALLKDNGFVNGASPLFDNIYELQTADDGSQTLVDTGVSDTRHVLSDDRGDRYASFVIPPNTKYLYLAYSYSGAELLPSYLKIGNNIILGAENGKDSKIYSEIFFDDFNALDTNVWRGITQEIPTNNEYNSRFVSNSKTIKVSDSCLVLSCIKDDGNNGTFIDKDGNEQPIEYVSGYISSDEKIALKSGRLSARIKTQYNTNKKMFPWCFWSYGQDNEWAIAHESDIVEAIIGTTTEEIISRSGTTITVGSINNYLGSHVHYRDSNNANSQKFIAYDVNYAIGGISASDTNFYKYEDIDTTEWHTYAVEWNSEKIAFFIDDRTTGTIYADDIDIADEAFNYPQDIRFNIKASEYNDQDFGCIFVDWVRAESLNLTPCLSISHPDVNLTVGEDAYIYPTFNNDCSNQAYSMESNSDCISITRYNSSASGMVINKISGILPGTATVTMTTPSGATGSFTVTVS